MEDLYFEINPKQNKILKAPKELELNWKNISGIIFLNKDDLYDLSWAGYPKSGFVKLSKENIDIIENLDYDTNILNVTKAKYKNIVSDNRYEKEMQTLLVDDSFSIQLTDKFKLHMLMKYNECISNKDLKFNWKTIGGPVEFNSEMFLKLYFVLQKYIQNLFDLEINLHEKIEDCKDIKSILDLDLTITCSDKIKL